jgi:hypothetical protein
MAELLVSIDDATMVPRLRRVIRSLHGVNKVSIPRKKPVRGASFRHQLMRLNELANLQQNWDDDGASPIEPQVVANIKQILELSTDTALSSWVLFPDINGTLLIKIKSKQASISIGTSEFSYAYTKEGESRRASHRPFSADAVIRLINEINVLWMVRIMLHES